MMHHQKSKKIFGYIFLFLVIGTLNNKNLNKFDLLNLKNIFIEGLDKETNFQLVENLNILRNSSLFFLEKIKIEEIIESNNLVEDYTVFKTYPSTINININKASFLAQFKKDGKNFFLGSNGKLIKTNDSKIDLPFIFGDFETESFFELKNAINDSNFDYKDIKNLFFFKSGRWDIETISGLLIKLPKNELKKSLKLFIRFSEKKDLNKIKKIDLRQRGQIIING